MEEFALRYLVSGIYSLGEPDHQWFDATLRAFTIAYFSYIATVAAFTITSVLALRRVRNRYIRTAGVTLLFVSLALSPMLYGTLLNLLRPVSPQSFPPAFIHTATRPVLLVVVGAALVAVALLRSRSRAEAVAA